MIIQTIYKKLEYEQLKVGLAMLMLAFDFIWMTLLAFYLDCVFPTDDSPRENPLFFLRVFLSTAF